jgi:hypothetical protein
VDSNALSQQPYLTFFSDETADYDVIVDQSSSAPNLKEATWGALQPLLPLVAERMGPDEMALVLEYSPMPESFLEKLKAIQDQKAQQPPPPDPEMVKIEAMKQAKAAELQMKQQETAVDVQMEQQKTAAQLQLEQTKAAAQIQLEREKAEAQVMIEQQKAALEQDKFRIQLAMEREKMAFEQERSKSEASLKHRAMTHELRLKTGLAKAGMRKPADGEEPGEMEEDDDLFGNKAVADALSQMSQAIAMLAQSQAQLAQSQAESNRAMAESVAQMGADLKSAMTKPKQIVRGPDGRAVGVQ